MRNSKSDMDNSLIPRDLGHRLQQLNQEIRTSLDQVRRHRRELENVERTTSTAAPEHDTFAEILRRSLHRDPSAADDAARSPTAE